MKAGELYISGYIKHVQFMHSIKISSKVEEATWNEVKALAAKTHQNVSGLLTDAVREYLSRKRVRPVVLTHLKHSIAENEVLCRLLAK